VVSSYIGYKVSKVQLWFDCLAEAFATWVGCITGDGFMIVWMRYLPHGLVGPLEMV
jgi:hypothetical protein